MMFLAVVKRKVTTTWKEIEEKSTKCRTDKSGESTGTYTE